MSGIGTTLTVKDGMSAALKNIRNSLNLTISSFERMQTVSGNPVVTQNITASASRVSTLRSRIQSATSAQGGFNNKVKEGTTAMDWLVKKVGALAAAYVGVRTALSGLNLSDELVGIEARLSLVNDGNQTTDQLKQMVMDAATASRGNYMEMVSNVSKLGITAGHAFDDNAEIVRFVENLNKQFTVAGASQTESANAMYQLTQAMASGRLQGDEYRSIIENAPLLAQSIADYAGVGLKELKEMSSEGAITSTLIKEALFSIEDSTNEMFNKIPRRWGDIWTSIKNQTIFAFEQVSASLSELAGNDAIDNMIKFVGEVATDAFDTLSRAVAKVVVFVDELSKNPEMMNMLGNVKGAILTLVDVLFVFFDATVTVLTWASRNWDWLKYVLLGVATALLLVKLYFLTTAAAASIATVSAVLFGTAVNIALWPISLTILAIIGAIYLFIWIMNKLTGESVSATGVIIGAFSGLFAVIYNFIAYIYNGFAAIAEFLTNVFNNPTYAIKRLFGNLFINILDMLISFVGKFIPGLASVRDQIASSLESSMPEDYKVYGTMNYKNVGDSLNAGYGFGADIGAGMSDAFSFSAFDPSQSALGSDVSLIAGNTGKTANALDKDNSLFDKLREYAKRDAVNKYTTAEVVVHMNNTNNISKEADADGIVSYLAKIVEESAHEIADGGGNV